MKSFLTALNIFLIMMQANGDSFDSVSEARKNCGPTIDSLFDSLGIEYPPEQVLIVAYKDAQVLQLWAKPQNGDTFLPVREYKFTAYCGTLGPKRKRGDLQIPEGFYHINCFNPRSRFHLALGINYPNASDRILGSKQDPGGDIAIHGSTVTIGCIPIGDKAIEEVYIICMDTKSRTERKIPVYIFPCLMDSTNMIMLKEIADEDTILSSFWTNLKKGYDIFIKQKTPIKFSVNRRGEYIYE
ncbi:MAG: L,D-transpeptidase family protein [bacterium]